ncbi:hypothetical protein L6R52_31125 [Myxococcota bacterium]|nr:hypothetical protein [Myxococcota bacterium]
MMTSSLRSLPRALALFAALVAGAAACGRAELEPLGAPGTLDAASTGDDGGVVPPGGDASVSRDASTPIDGAVPRDSGVRPVDASTPDGGVECTSAPECTRTVGRPPECPNGGIGTWTCVEGACVAACGPVECLNDCDCDVFLACLGGTCQPANRSNQCCTAPRCRPGDACELPGGGESLCPDPFDGGVPDGGRPRPDGGRPRPDGGMMPPDGGVDGGVPMGPAIGDPCTQLPGACGGRGSFCIDESSNFPGGYCSSSCTNTMCPVGAACLSIPDTGDFCFDACVAPSDCRAGYGCVAIGGLQDRICWPLPPSSTNPMGAPIGGACTTEQDCAIGLACLDEQSGFPGGYCTQAYCDPMTSPCPSGSECYAFSSLFSLCLATCPSGGSQSTCRPDYQCLGPVGQAGVCVGN